MSRMLKSSGAMALATLTSRVLGVVRETVYANFMGTTWVASAFIMAFQVPNLFRRLLGEGALTAAFIPIFKQKEVREGEQEMWRASNAVICGLMASAAAVIVIVVLALSVVLQTCHFEVQTTLMFRLLRLMFPYMLVVCLAAVLIGMANARGHFFVPALGAVLLNLVMIASVIFLAPHMGRALEQQIYGLAIGVLLAGSCQALFQLPSLMREGYRFTWVSPWRDPTVREVVRKMVPGSIGVAAFQLNVLLTQGFSFWVDPTIVSTFNYSVRLMEFPQGMFGISLATYLLPALSGLAAEKKYPEFREVLGQGLGYLAFANLAATAVAVSLAEPIVRLIFEHGKFGPESTIRVGIALSFLAPGLLMFSMVNILARAFYALHDINTPMRISIACLVLNLIFAFWLVQRYREAGLGLANTLSACLNVVLLTYALRRKLGHLGLSVFGRTLVVLISDTVLSAIVAACLSSWWEHRLGHRTLALKLGAVFVPGSIACLLYWLIAIWLKVPSAEEMVALLLRRFRRQAP